MNVYLEFLGCRLNEAEQSSWQREFQRLGHAVVASPEHAHVMAVNTCAVTGEASKKSRKLLKDLHQQNPQAKLVATGCYATLQAKEIAENMSVDMVVPNADKSQMAERILTAWGEDMPLAAQQPDAQPAFAQSRTRAFIKVQDGCRNRCSFCIVSTARGEEKSRHIAEIVEEINQLHEMGHQEVILTGVHLGGYGSDIGSDLRLLLKGIVEHTSIPRIRLGSLEPWDFPLNFLELWDNPRLCPHLHLPLQSGSDTVLRRMIRRCSVQEYKNIVQLARQQNPLFHITSDLIVGFPGETDKEFAETVANIQDISFGDMHFFSYSSRAGTPASRMQGQVPKHVIKERIQQIKPIVHAMKLQFWQQNLGQTDSVLWERDSVVTEQSGMFRWSGYTRNYIRVQCSSPELLFNTIRPVYLEKMESIGAESVLIAQVIS